MTTSLGGERPVWEEKQPKGDTRKIVAREEGDRRPDLELTCLDADLPPESQSRGRKLLPDEGATPAYSGNGFSCVKLIMGSLSTLARLFMLVSVSGCS